MISPREYEVLDLISLGYTTPEIASNLYVSKHTVITHRKNLLHKMKVKNAAGMVRKAFELGLLILTEESIIMETKN